MAVKSGKHIGLSRLTNKNVKPKESSIANHLLGNHTLSLDGFIVLANENKKRTKPRLSKNISSAQLHLFENILLFNLSNF